jgi:hypothetical protein
VVVNKVIFDGHVHDNQLMELFLTNYIIDPWKKVLRETRCGWIPQSASKASGDDGYIYLQQKAKD